MAHDSNDLRVHQFLRNGSADFRIGLVVLGDELDIEYFAVDLDLLGIGLINSKTYAVLVILAQMRDGTCQRTGVGDGYGYGRFSGCCGRGNRSRFCFFFTAADDTGSK